MATVAVHVPQIDILDVNKAWLADFSVRS